jgi:hypothetical protein
MMSVQAGYVSGEVAAQFRFRDRRPREVDPADLRAQPDLRPQFRLRPGQDDALIEWLDSLAPRRRSAAIREALYQHLAGRGGEGKGGEWAEDPDLAAALDALF